MREDKLKYVLTNEAKVWTSVLLPVISTLKVFVSTLINKLKQYV